jgi:leader peptidase (prepilin peptidase)/N-methyltransferase
MQSLQILFYILTALLGLAFGSFLNVCIFRIPKHESIVFGRSHCMECGGEIEARDLVPLFSYIFLRGQCRKCSAKISLRYPLVELLNALLWLAALWAFGITPYAFICMAFISGIIVVSFIDFDTKLVPIEPILFIFAVGVVSCFFSGGMPFYDKIGGVLAGAIPLLVISLVSRGGMGGGDVEFAGAAGLMLGWKLTLLALFCGFVTGGIYGAVLLLFAHRDGKSEMPFIPFIAAGLLISLFFGNTIINFYLSAFHLG